MEHGIEKKENEFKTVSQKFEELAKIFDEEKYTKAENRYLETVAKDKEFQEELKHLRERKSEREEDLRKIKENEAEMKKKERMLEEKRRFLELIHYIRDLFNRAPDLIAEQMVKQISQEADNRFREIMDDSTLRLEWTKEFEIIVHATGNRKRTFNQLSGGEQMAAAIAVRLAILSFLSNTDIVFLDEPTPHLDVEKRQNLARAISQLSGIKQMFVVSHDDTFIGYISNLIHLEKDENNHTHVTYGEYEETKQEELI